MMKHLLWVLVFVLLMSFANAALPGNSANGKKLHEANCGACHDSRVYTRKDRRIKSLDALKGQLQGCGHVAKKDFSPAEQQDIVKYLNEQFYHFR